MKFVKTELLNLKSSSEYNEKWVQQKIIEYPSILARIFHKEKIKVTKPCNDKEFGKSCLT